MGQRAILHYSLLLWGMFTAQTVSSIIFFFPIWLISFLAASRNTNENFDIIDMFWFINQVAFFNAPLQALNESTNGNLFQFGVNVIYGKAERVAHYQQDQILAFVAIIVISCIVNAIVLPKSSFIAKSKNFRFSAPFNLLLFLVVLSTSINIYAQGGFENILAPRLEKERNEGASLFIIFQSANLVFIYVFAISIRASTLRFRYLWIIFIYSILLLFYNPFNASRFSIIQAHLPVLVIFIPQILKFKRMATTLILGLVFIMPILSETTRHGTLAELSLEKFRSTNALSFLDQGTNLLHLVDMVERRGNAFGESTLGIILFFIPRAIWPEKPISVALVIGEELYGSGLTGTQNLSGPIIADLYLDFGFFGVLFGSYLVALLFRAYIKISPSIAGVPILMLYGMSVLPILTRGGIVGVAAVTLLPLLIFFALFKSSLLAKTENW